MEQLVEIFSEYDPEILASAINGWLKSNLVQIVTLTLTSTYEEDIQQTLITALILYIANE